MTHDASGHIFREILAKEKLLRKLPGKHDMIRHVTWDGGLSGNPQGAKNPPSSTCNASLMVARVLQRDDGLYFKSWTDFCLTPEPYGLGRSPHDLSAIIKDSRDPAAIAEITTPLPGHGEIGNGRSRESMSTSTGKRDASYLTARIARDNPTVLEEMKQGKYPSVRAQTALLAGVCIERALLTARQNQAFLQGNGNMLSMTTQPAFFPGKCPARGDRMDLIGHGIRQKERRSGDAPKKDVKNADTPRIARRND